MKLMSIIRMLINFCKMQIYKLNGVNVKCPMKIHFGRNVSLRLDKGSSLFLGKDVGFRDNVCVIARSNSELILGDNVFLNNGCQVFVHDKIVLGDDVKCGPNTMFFDHDHDFRCAGGVSARQYNCAPIIVGNGTWIGAGCIILKGTKVGDNCVIGAGSVLKGEIPSNTVVVQKRVNQILDVH